MTCIAVVTDIHHGTASHTKRGDTALRLLADFVTWSNAEGPDLVLEPGLTAPVHHLCGNHDRDHLSVAQNAEILGQPLENEVIDLGTWQLALWRAEAKINRHLQRPGFDLPEADLLWLSRMAQSAQKPTLVASHVPLSGHSQIGNYYFQGRPQLSTYPQHLRALAALSQARVPMACVAGHVHWNTVTTIDGIPHLTQQSLTESFTTAGAPAGAWGMIELGAQLHWQVRGDDPFEARLSPTARRWTPPLAPCRIELAAQ
jgi:hypothetical protein